MKRYCKRLNVYFASADDTPKIGCWNFLLLLLGAIAFVIITPILLTFIFGERNPCKIDPQKCYCNTLAITPAKDRADIVKEMKKRGYTCDDRYYWGEPNPNR